MTTSTNESPIADSVSIELKNISKHYGSTLVLKPFSLTLEPGCRTVLLGPSGCGKTTLLRIISGLETPDEGGSVVIGGADLTHVPAEKRRIGFMFQQYALFPHMTVEENIAYGLKIRGEPKEKIDEAVSRMLALVNLEKYRRRSVLALSGGQRQRVALVRALAIRPRVLLLDEPLSALDAQIRHKVREELAVILKRLGITAVIVTHDQDEAMVLGDRIVVMEGGLIHQVGTPEEVWQRPATSFVAGFVGSSNKVEASYANGRLAWFGVEADASNLSASSCERLAGFTGGRALVFFRSEDAKLSFGEAPAAGGIPVVVRNAHFMGSFVRVTVVPESCMREGRERLLKVNAPSLPEGAEPGARAWLSVDPQKLFVYPAP